MARSVSGVIISSVPLGTSPRRRSSNPAGSWSRPFSCDGDDGAAPASINRMNADRPIRAHTTTIGSHGRPLPCGSPPYRWKIGK